MKLYKSLKNGQIMTKEEWLRGWEEIFNDLVPEPPDLWERFVRVAQLEEICSRDS